LGTTAINILNFFASLCTPLFIIASFGLVLNKNKRFQDLLLIYGLGFVGIALGVSLFYARYVSGLFIKIGGTLDLVKFIGTILGEHVEINVFADLFMFLLFHYFLNYTPKKVFVGKKLIIFRLFMIIPVAYVITSYVFKLLAGFGVLLLPFYIHTLMTTKSPLVFALFASVALWIKYRERLLIRIGATPEQCTDYLRSKCGSLSFSLCLSSIICLFFLVELIITAVFALIFATQPAASIETISYNLSVLQLGQCGPLLVTIPFIMLYSHSKVHKNTTIDILIPVIAIGLIILLYVESIYQGILYWLLG